MAARDGVDRVPAFFLVDALTPDLAVVDVFLVGAAFLVVVVVFFLGAAVVAFLAVAAFFFGAAGVAFLVAAFLARVATFLVLGAAEAFLVVVVLVSFLLVVDDEDFSGFTSLTVPDVPKSDPKSLYRTMRIHVAIAHIQNACFVYKPSFSHPLPHSSYEHTFRLRKYTLVDTTFDSIVELRVKVGIGSEIIVGKEILFQSLTRASFTLLELDDCSYINRY